MNNGLRANRFVCISVMIGRLGLTEEVFVQRGKDRLAVPRIAAGGRVP